MEQVERIRHMEELLDKSTQAVSNLEAALDLYSSVQNGLQELDAYYQSPLWRKDFDDDCAGKLPADLKRGVLSEDAVYDLLTDNRELLSRLAAYRGK